MKPRVVVALPIFADQLQRLQALADVVTPSSAEPLAGEALRTALGDADAALISVFQPIDAATVDAAPRLRLLANIGVGTDHIDLEACARAGIRVTATPGVVDHPTADLAFALLLATARKVCEADAFVRAGHWTQPSVPILGLDVHHRTLGIVGLGGIGRQIARRAAGFDMPVLYTQRQRADVDTEQALNARYVSLDELLAQSDFVILQVPYTPQTHHLIGARELSLMKKTSLLINTARGGVVDDAALAAALEAGTIAGAGLDVVENEPAILPALLKAPGVTLMPHLGSATLATRQAMVALAVDNLIAGLGNGSPVA